MSLAAWLQGGAGLVLRYTWWKCARMVKPDLLCESMALCCEAFTHISFKTELRGSWCPDHGAVIYFPTDCKEIFFYFFLEKIVNLSSLWCQVVIFVICCLSSLAGTLLSCLTLCFPTLNSISYNFKITKVSHSSLCMPITLYFLMTRYCY